MSDVDLNLVTTEELIDALSDRCDNLVIIREILADGDLEFNRKYNFRMNRGYMDENFNKNPDMAALAIMSDTITNFLIKNIVPDEDIGGSNSG